MTLEEAKVLAEKTIDATHPLTNGSNKRTNQFSNVVYGTHLRSYLNLYTMYFLAKLCKPEEKMAFGSVCMDLSRSLLENVISLEYMLYKGKEEMAQKFLDYGFVEAKRDNKFAESVNITIKPNDKKFIDEEYEKIKTQFIDRGTGKSRKKAWQDLTEFLLEKQKIDESIKQEIEKEYINRYPNNSGEPRDAWAGLSTEGMMNELFIAGKITDKDKKILGKAYIMGNRKNHFSPTDIANYVFPDRFEFSKKIDLETSLLFAVFTVIRIASIFIEEIKVSEEVEKTINELADAFKKL